jgi:LacI family transcriptional regulator
MERTKEVTIYDIAKKLNLSTATISRALHDSSDVNKKTKKKVLQTVAELGYRTNYFARNLRNKQTFTIGVIVHELRSYFITSVLAGIERVATQEGYDIIMTHSSESYPKEIANVKNLFNKRVDGVIASLSFDTNDVEHFKLLTEKKIPLVFFDRVQEDGNNTVVIIDNYKSGYSATQHLIDQGCKNIAHITSSLKRNVYAERCRGYKDALLDNKMKFDESKIITIDLAEASGIQAAMQVMRMKPMPDGVFITNDFLAAVFMQTLKEHQYKIPDDIAVVGFNNDIISKLVEPTLTTINYPGFEIGEIAATNLFNLLKETDNIQKPKKIIALSNLIIRNSSLRKK